MTKRPGVFSRGYRRLATAVLLITSLVAFEGLSVTAALPEIGAALGSVNLLPWVVTSYMVASGFALAVAGPVIDAVGARRVFRWSTLAFLVSSLVCGLAPSMLTLIVARALQGFAGGAVMSTSSASIGLGYPESVRSRAYAMASTIWGVLAFGGPALAALVLTAADWRWIFLCNVPLCLLAAVAGWTAVPGPPEGESPLRLDLPGGFWLLFGLCWCLFGVSRFDRWGVLGLGLATLAGAVYWRHSGRSDAPVLARRHFAGRPFGLLAASAAFIMGAGIGAETYLPLYLRATRGVGIALAAWSVLFLTVGWTLGANVASRLYSRIDERQMTVLAAATMPPSLLLAGAAAWWEWPLPWLFAIYTLVGLAVGATTNPCLTLVQFLAEPSEVGRATTAHQFLRTMAATLGAALAGTVIFAVTAAQGADVESVRELLSGEGAPASSLPEAAEGVAGGFAFAHIVAAAASLFGLAAAVRSARSLPKESLDRLRQLES
ncbi:MAG: MFS transporter [Acidobacteriota bacterium]